MPKRIDLSGKRYGRLVAIRFHGKNERRKSLWLCRCDCGKEKIVNAGNLNSGNTTSCGCFNLEVIKEVSSTHGLTGTPEHDAWVNMIQRCTNPNNEDYYRWGGRGVKVCDRWLNSFEAFYEDTGPRPSPKHSLDRWPNNETGHYEPGNFRWATKKEQNRNRRSNHWIEYNGMKMIVQDWASYFNLKKASCLTFYLKNHTMEEAYEHYKHRIG
jgi:hypothetical protein